MAFLRDPLIFHASHWTASIHRNLLTNSDQWSTAHDAVAHKTEAMRLLRTRLGNVSEGNLDWVIYAVLCLVRTERPSEDQSFASSLRLLPFVPHAPSANHTSTYAKSELVDVHRHALKFLVEQRGGLQRIEIPGLVLGLALCVIAYMLQMGDVNVLNPRLTCTEPT